MFWVVLTLPIGRPFGLVSMPFFVCFICSALSYFLALQTAPGSLFIWRFLCSSPGVNRFTKELCFCQLKKKKKKTPKPENAQPRSCRLCFILGVLLTEDCAARETALQTALRTSSKERKEEPGYVGDFAGEKKCTQRSKDYCHSEKKPDI